MLKRLVVSAVGISLLFAILLLLESWVMIPIICLLSAIAVYELLYATGFLKLKRLLFPAILFAALVPYWVSAGCDRSAALIAVIIYVMISFLFGILQPEKITFTTICGTFFASFVIPYFFSSVILIYCRDEVGLFYLLLTLVIAWGTDASAMLCGMMFGRHKLIPRISPKKTVEGSIGGMVGALALSALYITITNHYFQTEFSYLPVLCMAFFGSIVGQLGDLSMSYIKREYGIKDYGKILPGHGGILDRFDSVLFVAPVVQAVLYVMEGLFL